jgi:hypothetical protein
MSATAPSPQETSGLIRSIVGEVRQVARTESRTSNDG